MSHKKVILLIIISAFTFLLFYPSLNGEFLNWDDTYYVKNNPFIKNINTENIKVIFSKGYMGNYHPLTMLSLALDYKIGNLDPFTYHLTNVIIHILNTCLIFFLINLLFNKPIIALSCCLLFGIHPIHVESVAWISERKDVLYTFFYLLAWISYIKYIQVKNYKFYILSLIIFTFSLLSKGQAVTLSLIIVLTDLYLGRSYNSKKVILEKVPYFLLSLIFGITAVGVQSIDGAIKNSSYFSFPIYQKFIFSCASFVHYLSNTILPIKLMPLYTYPIKAGDEVPLIYHSFILFTLIILFLIWKSYKKNKIIFFGSMFFLLNLLPLLQFIQVGYAMMADRYAYIPSIGIFIIMGYLLHNIKRSKAKFIYPLSLFIFGLFISYLSYYTFNQCKAWNNTLALWDNAISNDSQNPILMHKRAKYHIKIGDFERALIDLNNATTIDSEIIEIIIDRGVCYYKLKKYELALKDFNMSIKQDPLSASAFLNRGILYYKLNKTTDALKDIQKCIKLDPKNATAFYNYGIIKTNTGSYKEAISSFNKATNIKKLFPTCYNERGVAYFKSKKFKLALQDFNKSIQQNKRYALPYYNRGLIYILLKEQQKGCQDLITAQELGNKDAEIALKKHCR